MKRLNQLLTICMAAFTGAFLGHGLYLAWDFHARPELYASWSAPWYTQLLVPGIVLACVLLLGGAGKLAITVHLKKKQ